VVPKRADGFGNEAFSTKTLEFMACGVPVVVARTRVDAYYFDDRVVSFFEPGNAADLAKVLLQSYRDRNGQHQKIAAAHELASRLGWQVHSGDYRSLVDSLIASPSFRQGAPAQETR
jgi:glycosyltransferase involved in cell wall biosynthesis